MYNEKKEFKDFYKIVGVYKIETVDDGLSESQMLLSQANGQFQSNINSFDAGDSQVVLRSRRVSSEMDDSDNEEIEEFDENVFQNLGN